MKKFKRIVRDATSAIEAAGIPFIVIGGIPTAIHGGVELDPGEDLDLFVGARDARRSLEVLGTRGFETSEKDPFWMLKGSRRGITVDLIFRLSGDIYLEAEMVSRAAPTDFFGLRLPLVSPEDLVVMKAIDHNEQRGHVWHDALRILSRCKIDWRYLVRRARLGPRRVLSLLIYAESLGSAIPQSATGSLREQLGISTPR